MKRKEYMVALEKHLKRLPKEEKENALIYYNEYFDDAGVTQEHRVIEELGSPIKLAAQLRGEYALKDTEGSEKKTPVILIVLLAIFGAPIALPLAIAVAAVVFSLIVTVFALLFSFVATAAALVLGGITSMVMGLFVLFQNPATTVFSLGLGLICLGFGTLLGVGMYKLIPLVIEALKRLAAKILEWRKKA